MEKMLRARGFSLIELAVTLAATGILMAVAYPAYSDYVLRSRRAEGANALAQVQLAQERWRGNNNSYASSLSALGLPSTSAQGHYALEVTAAAANGWSATATASSAQQLIDTKCRTLTLVMAGGNITYGSSNASGATDSGGANRCWAR